MAQLQTEALEQAGDRLRPHLEAVPLAELCDRLRAGRNHTAHSGQLREEALEAGGRDDLEDPARLVAGVPEGVPLAARLEHEVARPCLGNLVAQQRTHPPL